ncbi:A-kinase anchor protein 10, mitochondrial [Diabrotica virgifera virgifera]|uniref:A-kinase anchor protein 10, mitochondrial n=1 Tax=Diabrotica virgifera virgifera TaxID=50390 RepID=A0A6P7GLM0_DIAVI|nr:A-kinase anchor protein 10, mitochondrial [Diabrotica virgifera virgifera]
MLQFLKKANKSGQQKYSSNNPPHGSKEKDHPIIPHENVSDSFKANCGKTTPLPLSSFDDEGLFDIGELEATKDQSRLTRTLQETISDKNALAYFTHYMESRGACDYIHCWSEIQTFKSFLKDNQNLQTMKNFPHSPVPHSNFDHDSLSVSTDCDSYTADSNSLYDYSATTLSEGKTPQDNTCDKESDESNFSEKRSVQSIVDKALLLFKKYIAQEALCNIKCTEEMRKEIMENICNTDKVLSINCFDTVENYVYNIMQDEYFASFLASDYFCKYQIDLLTGGNISLDDILYNETALFYFMEYLEQENQRSLLEFWIAASNFQQQLHDQKDFFDHVEAQTDAVVLYDKYFSLQATCPLGFSDKVRFAVEQSICGENGLMPDCFHLPLKIVETVLEKNYLKPFLTSQLFYKYLSDLINTVQVNDFANFERYPNAASDCSSERSFSQSTFLAFEIPPSAIKRRDKSADMTIDTRELYDPDSLWKRKKCYRLSLGRVSEIGKYEADFEPEPDRKQFRFKSIFKKVVNNDEEDRKREEMAWQVAEMIVKDITNVTLGQSDK